MKKLPTLLRTIPAAAISLALHIERRRSVG